MNIFYQYLDFIFALAAVVTGFKLLQSPGCKLIPDMTESQLELNSDSTLV